MREPRLADGDEIEGGKVRSAHARVQKLNPIRDNYVVRRRLDKGEYEGANESVVDERTRGSLRVPCTLRAVPYALTFGRASTNRCLSGEAAVPR